MMSSFHWRIVGIATVVLFALTVVLVPTSPSHAASAQRVRHVSPDGADPASDVCSGGSAERPWGTIRVAIHCLEPGDTLYVHGGTPYRERVKITTTPATREKPIVVTGAPGGPRPVIEGGLRIENPSWWTVQDLEIIGDGLDYDDGGTHLLKMLGGSNWTVQRVELHDAATYSLMRVTPTPNGAPPVNWRVLDSCFHDTLPKHGTPDAPPYPDHNMYVYTGPSGGPGLIQGNVMFGAPNGQNLKLGNSDGQDPGDGANRVTVRHNTLVDAAQNITVVGPSNDNIIERNILAEVNYGESWYPNVRGIHLRGTGNVARDNAWSGAAAVVHNQTGNTTGVADGGNLRVSPGFTDRGCDEFLPTDAKAAPYGAEPRDLSGVDIPVERVAGADRFATAIEISREVHESAELVLLARGDAYPDALASSALAGLHRVPVLLTPRDHVPAPVLDELARLDTSRVLLLGGRGALGQGVVDDLRAAGLGVDRVAGATRFETATRVADLVTTMRADGVEPQVGGPNGEVILVEGANANPGRGWPDAVSAGQLAAAAGIPVLLTQADALPRDTRAWLAANRPNRVTIVGGSVAVSNQVVAEVEELAGDVRRISGTDRYATSQAVADELTRRRGSSTPPTRTFVASGRSFPDAMAVGPAAALAGSVVVLYGEGEESYERLRSYVGPVPDDELVVTVVGGPAAVPDTLETRWRLDAADEG